MLVKTCASLMTTKSAVETRPIIPERAKAQKANTTGTMMAGTRKMVLVAETNLLATEHRTITRGIFLQFQTMTKRVKTNATAKT